MPKPAECSGSRRYGAVRVEWSCDRISDRCHVKVFWSDALIVDDRLNAGRRVLPFSLTSEHDASVFLVEGEFRFDPAIEALCLAHLRTTDGVWRDQVLCPNGPPPPPPPPPDPEPSADTEESEILEGASDLFPYVYLRDWPAASDEQVRDRFVLYDMTTCVPGDQRLYCTLVAVDPASPGAREAMVRQAVAFVEGRAPYDHQYAAQAQALVGEINTFAAFSVHVANQPPIDIARFIAELERTLHQSWSQTMFYLGSESFAEQLDRAWQNVFALVIALGYNRSGAEQMIRTVAMAQLLLRMAASTPGGEEDATARPPIPPASLWTPRRIREGVFATVVLPHRPFPLPPRTPTAADGEPPSDAGAPAHPTSSVTPYAVGELRLVRRKLLRYEPGELSHIENVMAGERKTSATRDRQVERSLEVEAAGSRDDARSATTGLGTSFDAQARRALREHFRVDYETNYGPPTESKQKGYVIVGPEGADPTRAEDGERNELARDITTLAARRLSQEVHLARTRETRREHETEVRHTFDRRNLDGNARGIYRWLNAVYRCWVSTRGRRFILELLLPQPARNFIAAQYDLAGVDLVEPLAPVAVGLHAFTDISLDPGSTLYYAKLSARYGVVDVQPPPPPMVTLAATFESGTPLTMQVLPVPAGYSAQTAGVLLTSANPGYSATGTIGNQRFQVTAADPAPTTLGLSGQTVSLPLALTVAAPGQAGSKGDDDPPALAPWALVIEVAARASSTLVDRWKSELYARLLAGYQRQRRSYLDVSGVHAPANGAPDALAWRTAVRDEIKRDGLRALAHLVAQRTGEVGREARFLPALLRDLEHTFEWSEMSYSFLVDLEHSGHHAARRIGGEDELITAFLQAAYARVLLPVTPGRQLAAAFLLATGMVWDAIDELAPTFDVPVAPQAGAGATRWLDVVNDLKQDGLQTQPGALPPAPLEGWTIVLPTTMTYLQDGSELPVFDRRDPRR